VTRPSGSETLATQRALLDAARAALGGGDSAGALAALDTHERRFPNSVLSEEREALAIKALAGAGRLAEARARGARFRSRYPNSIMRPAIDATLATIP
jgi:outer membrane protein assembly factor BamD (BamD/ComL family)